MEAGDRKDRRAAPVAQFFVNAVAEDLRESLKRIDGELLLVEEDTRRRIRLLLAEVIGRASDPRRHPRGLIRVSLTIFESSVRLDVAGPALLAPSEITGAREAEPMLPYWVLDELADRWAFDRRSSEPAMWFLIARLDQRAVP